MTQIGIISDTHGYLDPRISQHFASCDEIWHIGDFGTLLLADQLGEHKPLRGVFGNIDGLDIRAKYPLYQSFKCEEVNVLMTHIGGFPPKYNKDSLPLIKTYQPQLFLSGHSHITKVMYDERLQCLHINPGAAGKHGWQKVRTIVRICIDGKSITKCEVIELKDSPAS